MFQKRLWNLGHCIWRLPRTLSSFVKGEAKTIATVEGWANLWQSILMHTFPKYTSASNILFFLFSIFLRANIYNGSFVTKKITPSEEIHYFTPKTTYLKSSNLESWWLISELIFIVRLRLICGWQLQKK